MKIKQIVKNTFLGMLVVFGFLGTLSVTPALAAGNNGCETNTAIIKCNADKNGDGVADVNVDDGGVENTGLWAILLLAINILTAGVGLAAIGGVIYGSVLYASAAGSAEQVKKAIGIITNVVIGVVAYALMFSLLNFIIPGGLFS